jgi:hypothetical protein
MGFLSVLTLLFIALKLMNFIDWSWWWVVSPMIVDAVMMITVLFSIATYYVKKK